MNIIKANKLKKAAMAILAVLLLFACSDNKPEYKPARAPVPDLIKEQVAIMGEPRVERISEHVWAAISYDLANVVLINTDDAKWAIHLLAKLKDSGQFADAKRLDEKLIIAYEKLAAKAYNLNGRGYLLQSAYELEHGVEKPQNAKLDPEMVASLPLELIFTAMVTRLIPEKAMDVHESVHFVFPDENKKFIVTIRKGIAEVSIGKPLPGTPEPVATLITNGDVYRKIAVENKNPATFLVKGELKIEGSMTKFVAFLGRFDRSR